MDVLADGVWENTFKVKTGSIYKRREESMAGPADRCCAWF